MPNKSYFDDFRDNIMQTIGQELKKFREDRNISQAVLADFVGITRFHLSRIEGEKAKASLHLVKRFQEIIYNPKTEIENKRKKVSDGMIKEIKKMSASGLSNKSIAEKLNISKSYVQQIVTGKRHSKIGGLVENIRIKVLERIDKPIKAPVEIKKKKKNCDTIPAMTDEIRELLSEED